MAEFRKRNAKAPSAKKSRTAPTSAPIGNNHGLYLIVAVIAALAVYHFQFQSHSSPANSSSTSGPSGSSTAPENDKIQLTDEQLASYTGADPEKPIYIALNGTIFDVSSGRSFYGPGGHYGHFAGRDATRAWVTTCFQPEHLTWDMKGVEAMFVPKWMDEEIESAADGRSTEALPEGLKEQAATLMQKIGKVTEAEKKRRREEDAEEVKEKIEEAMAHWINFFKNSPKYNEVGVIVGRKPLDEDRADIGLCEDALKKRPVKGVDLRTLWE
ncbi:Membrane steroid-binding 2 [Hyphodiscus hymeniophilus]|uniref:Membrane steroid-binding 2 n=1 Tax=Hyphodiscus hymeniophilus TaxID=353542 RepID=A0A9P7AXI8_9HELO|nr:Membrane steroid-binding 2 [Hyphodiscus hymeniophilus]